MVLRAQEREDRRRCAGAVREALRAQPRIVELGRLADRRVRLHGIERAKTESPIDDLWDRHRELFELADEVLAHAHHDLDVGCSKRLPGGVGVVAGMGRGEPPHRTAR